MIKIKPSTIFTVTLSLLLANSQTKALIEVHASHVGPSKYEIVISGDEKIYGEGISIDSWGAEPTYPETQILHDDWQIAGIWGPMYSIDERSGTPFFLKPFQSGGSDDYMWDFAVDGPITLTFGSSNGSIEKFIVVATGLPSTGYTRTEVEFPPGIVGPGIFQNYNIEKDSTGIDWINTDSWMGYISVQFFPWIYILDLNSWAYIPEPHSLEANNIKGVWMYLLK